MHHVNGIKGYTRWKENGQADWIEDPTWRKHLQLDEEGTLRLNTGVAVQLGLLHSRQYQSELENMYLFALALTLERFEFDVQWSGGSTPSFQHTKAGNPSVENNTLDARSNLGFSRALATGGQLLVDFANSFVWEFAGKNTHSASSNVLVSLVQPLLRGAGRQVRLESLTQAERDVLYAVRQFARFRKQFYFDIASGRDGYLSLLLRLQNIRNLEANLASLQQNLRAHEALADTGVVSKLQVDQVFQSYQSGRLSLIRAQNAFETALDAYKIRMGLPPDLATKLDDSLLSPFQLTDPAVTDLENKIEDFLSAIRQLDQKAPLGQLGQVDQLLRSFHRQLEDSLGQADAELARWWRASAPEPVPGQEQAGSQRDRDLQHQLIERLVSIREDLQTIGRQIDQVVAVDLGQRQRIEDLVRRQSALVADLFVIQTQIRAYLIQLKPVAFEPPEAIDFALKNRLDLKNRQGEVVDAWRQIHVAADGLESDLDVFLEGDIGTPPDNDNPVKFSSNASRYRLGVQFDGPLNRKAERNVYRNELINYQRARRDYMARQDEIVQSVRRDLRQLDADRLNFVIARQRLIAAARQVELARVQLLAPGQAGDSSTTSDVLNALGSLLEAKNELIGTWVAYETGRLQLLVDLEALELDERGMYADGQRD